MTRLAVFASGTGSNFEAIVKAIEEGRLTASIGLLVCDQPVAPVIEKARKSEIESLVVTPKSFVNKADYEQHILRVLKEKEIDVLVLAGYMRLIGPTLLLAYPSKIINIHPSLLPAFAGLHAIEKAFASGVKETGVTVHLVDEGMDTGPILAQEPLSILPNETIEELKTRIHMIEHRLYPQILQKFITKG